LNRLVWSDAGIDLDKPCSTGQNIDQTIEQLVQRRVLDHFLLDLDTLSNGGPDVQLAELDPDSDQTGTRRVLDLLFHIDCLLQRQSLDAYIFAQKAVDYQSLNIHDL
jgi:hypothetical protein